MAIKINPNHQLLWRDTNVLQLGVGAASVQLSGLTSAEERFIDALYFGLPTDAIAPMAHQLRVSEPRSRELLDAVSPLLVRTPQTEPDPTEYTAVAAAERVRASLANGADHRLVLTKRKTSTVFIAEMDATGLTVLLALAAAGVGTVVSRDSAMVSREDAATNLYPLALVGRPRVAAARLILDSSWPGTRLLNYSKLGDRRTVRYDVAMLTSHQVTDPAAVGAWRTGEIPVIEVRYQPDGVEVSPVLDGRDGCLVCRDHRLQDLDPSHIAMCSQLFGSDLRFDDAAARLVGSGLAVSSVLQYIDAGIAVAHHRYDRDADAVYSYPIWGAHPACGCGVWSRLGAAEAETQSETQRQTR